MASCQVDVSNDLARARERDLMRAPPARSKWPKASTAVETELARSRAAAIRDTNPLDDKARSKDVDTENTEKSQISD